MTWTSQSHYWLNWCSLMQNCAKTLIQGCRFLIVSYSSSHKTQPLVNISRALFLSKRTMQQLISFLIWEVISLLRHPQFSLFKTISWLTPGTILLRNTLICQYSGHLLGKSLVWMPNSWNLSKLWVQTSYSSRVWQ